MRKDILKELEPYKLYGHEVLQNGTELIGKAKFIAPLAYLHSIFAPNGNEVEIIEDKLKILLPNDLKVFFGDLNGFNLFSTSFSIWGLRTNTSRSIDAVRQPFDLFEENTMESIQNNNVLVIGGYSWNGGNLNYDMISGEVFYSAANSINPLFAWRSFESMIFDEIRRLRKLHTDDGKNIPFRPTVPVGGIDVLERMINKERKSYPYWYEDTISFMKKHSLTVEELAKL